MKKKWWWEEGKRDHAQSLPNIRVVKMDVAAFIVFIDWFALFSSVTIKGGRREKWKHRRSDWGQHNTLSRLLFDYSNNVWERDQLMPVGQARHKGLGSNGFAYTNKNYHLLKYDNGSWMQHGLWSAPSNCEASHWKKKMRACFETKERLRESGWAYFIFFRFVYPVDREKGYALRIGYRMKPIWFVCPRVATQLLAILSSLLRK